MRLPAGLVAQQGLDQRAPADVSVAHDEDSQRGWRCARTHGNLLGSLAGHPVAERAEQDDTTPGAEPHRNFAAPDAGLWRRASARLAGHEAAVPAPGSQSTVYAPERDRRRPRSDRPRGGAAGARALRG